MSYLQIFPRRIFATLNANGIFEGELTLHIEQYGLQENDKKCDVKILHNNGRWQIWVQPVSSMETPQFLKFVESLNNYFFKVLNLAPSQQSTSSPLIDVHFDDVYFDLSGQDSVIKVIAKQK